MPPITPDILISVSFSAPLVVSSKFETVCKQIPRTLPLSSTGGPSRYPASKLSPLVVSVAVSQSYSECVLFQRLCLPYCLISEKQTLIKLTVIPCIHCNLFLSWNETILRPPANFFWGNKPTKDFLYNWLCILSREWKKYSFQKWHIYNL